MHSVIARVIALPGTSEFNQCSLVRILGDRAVGLFGIEQAGIGTVLDPMPLHTARSMLTGPGMGSSPAQELSPSSVSVLRGGRLCRSSEDSRRALQGGRQAVRDGKDGASLRKSSPPHTAGGKQSPPPSPHLVYSG